MGPRSPVLIISTWASRLSEDNDEICRGEESKNKLNTTNRVRNKQFVTTAKLPELTELPTTVIKKASYSTIQKKKTLIHSTTREQPKLTQQIGHLSEFSRTKKKLTPGNVCNIKDIFAREINVLARTGNSFFMV